MNFSVVLCSVYNIPTLPDVIVLTGSMKGRVD